MEEVNTKEKLKIVEMENSNLKSKLMQLEGQVNECFHIKLQKDIMDKKLSGLQLEMIRKRRRIKKLKSQNSKSRQEIVDKDSSLQKMMQHVKKIWVLLLEFGNKLRKNGLLTIEEKNNIKKDYEEWVNLLVNTEEGETEEVFKMLNELPTSLFDVLNISECSEINQLGFSKDENVTSSPIASTPKAKASNSNKSLGETDYRVHGKLDKKPQTKPYSKIKNCDQVTKSQVVKETKKPQCSKQLSRIDQYKAILRKNSTFSDNSLVLHSKIVSKFQSKATVSALKKNNTVRVENKRTTILLPGLPMKTSKKSLDDEKNTSLQGDEKNTSSSSLILSSKDSSLILSSKDSSKRSQLSKSHNPQPTKRQKVALNESTLDKTSEKEEQDRLTSEKQSDHIESHNELNAQSECNKNLKKADRMLENKSWDEQSDSEKIHSSIGKPKTISKQLSNDFEKASLDNVIENSNEKFDSTLYNHSQLRTNHVNFSPKCETITKDLPKFLETQTLDAQILKNLYTTNVNESPIKEKKLMDSKKITNEHVALDSEPKDNCSLPQNCIPCSSFNLPSKNKDLCQTSFKILSTNTESPFFNSQKSKIPIVNEKANIETNIKENSENKIEKNSECRTSLFASTFFKESENFAVSDGKQIKKVEDSKIGFPSEKGYSISDSDSECNLVIDEDFENDMHLFSKKTHTEPQEEMIIGCSNRKYIPESKEGTCILEYNSTEESIASKVKDNKSLETIGIDINEAKRTKGDTYSLGFQRRENLARSTATANAENNIISSCHNKVELVASKDVAPERIIESSKITMKIEHKAPANTLSEQTCITSACVNKESNVDKDFDVGAILKLQSETFKFKSKNKILEKDSQEENSSTFSIKKCLVNRNNNKICRKKQKRKQSQAIGINFNDNSLKIERSKLQSERPYFNNRNPEKDFPGVGNSTFPIAENSKIEQKNQRKLQKKISRKQQKKHLKEKQRINYTGNPLDEFFKDFKKIEFSQENFEQNIENLFLVLSDPSKAPNNSTLLFHVLNYLRKFKSDKELPLSHSSCEDLSVPFPLNENCIVTTLFLIEMEKLPHLEGLLNTAVTTFYHIIISKKNFSMFSLATLCRVFTQICKCQGNNLKPVLLCGDLLKMKHRFAPYLIASIASVWKELFQIGNNLPAEEVLFHSSILYGASKRPKCIRENNWNSCIKFISKCFTALPVNDARSAIQMLMELIQLRCKDDTWNNHYLSTSLIILIAQEDWDWTEEFILNKYIIPNLTKYGSETLNENAFDLYCNMYVDAFLLKPGNPLDKVLTKFFDSSELFPGGNPVKDSAALALMRFVYLKNRMLPLFLSSWFENNCEKAKVQQIRPYFERRVMGKNLGDLLEEDVLYIQ